MSRKRTWVDVSDPYSNAFLRLVRSMTEVSNTTGTTGLRFSSLTTKILCINAYISLVSDRVLISRGGYKGGLGEGAVWYSLR